MLDHSDLKAKPWWGYIEVDLQDLLSESLLLLNKASKWDQKFHDYSFVVFPAAKAYEGFLKKIFVDMGFISQEAYFGKRFRIGKALNPSLDLEHRDKDWVYDDLDTYCQGKDLPNFLWDTWKQARNLVFHWFPNELNAVDLSEAQRRIEMVIEAIDKIFDKCSVQLNTKP